MGPTRPSYDQMRYLHTLLDYATGWQEAYPTADKFATSTARNWKIWQAGRTPDKECRSDNGGEFEKEFHDALIQNGTAHTFSTPNDPASNSRIERSHDDLNNGIRCALLQYGAAAELPGHRP